MPQEGWLKTHRRDWYRRHLHINYSTRIASFSSTQRSRQGSRDRRLTGLDGPSASARFQHSFPQPDHLDLDPDNDTNPAADTHNGRALPRLEIPHASSRKSSVQTLGEDEFVDAVSEPDDDLRVYTHQEREDEAPGPATVRRQSTVSFVTASSRPSSPSPPAPRPRTGKWLASSYFDGKQEPGQRAAVATGKHRGWARSQPRSALGRCRVYNLFAAPR